MCTNETPPPARRQRYVASAYTDLCIIQCHYGFLHPKAVFFCVWIPRSPQTKPVNTTEYNNINAFLCSPKQTNIADENLPGGQCTNGPRTTPKHEEVLTCADGGAHSGQQEQQEGCQQQGGRGGASTGGSGPHPAPCCKGGRPQTRLTTNLSYMQPYCDADTPPVWAALGGGVTASGRRTSSGRPLLRRHDTRARVARPSTPEQHLCPSNLRRAGRGTHHHSLHAL